MRHWARDSGRRALGHFNEVEVEWKQGQSLVTEADREIEKELRNRIRNSFPDDAITGEEFDSHRSEESQWEWFLDPIDGTAAFSMGLPVWSVSISAWSEDGQKLGVVWAPFLRDEHFVSTDGEVLRGGNPVTCEPPTEQDWNRQTLFCVPSTAHRNYEIDFPGKCRSLGSTAYHMSMVVDGRAIATLMGPIHIWDIAAGVAMGDRLGLKLRRIDGTEPDWQKLVQGGTPQKPLLFGKDEVIDQLANRVEPKSNSD